jgi:hypothetical protein
LLAGVLLALAVSNFDRCSPGLPDLLAAHSLEVGRSAQLEGGLFTGLSRACRVCWQLAPGYSQPIRRTDTRKAQREAAREAKRSSSKPGCSQLEAGLFIGSLPDRSEAKQLAKRSEAARARGRSNFDRCCSQLIAANWLEVGGLFAGPIPDRSSSRRVSPDQKQLAKQLEAG